MLDMLVWLNNSAVGMDWREASGKDQSWAWFSIKEFQKRTEAIEVQWFSG